MKWLNRQHEFDEIGKQFENQKKIFIYGAGENGKILFDKIKFIDCVEGFIDNDEKKQISGFLGKRVESFADFIKRDKEKFIVIIAASLVNAPILLDQLINNGYTNEKNCFLWTKFCEDYLSIYSSYGWNKLYFNSISFLPTTFCNLNCNACLNFTSFNKKKRNRELEDLIKDIDIYFQWVDYTDLFHISGGEPLLYPKLDKLIEYIGVHYRDKINNLAFTTNGTLVPSDDLCEVIQKYDVNVILNDYTNSIGQKDINNEIVEMLQKRNLRYSINKVETWIDLAPLTTNNSHMNEEMLVNYYNSCQVPYASLREGRISSCNYSDYATEAGIIQDKDEDYFLLTPLAIQKKRELMEFRIGYTKRGYVNLCKQCAGYLPINKNIVSSAVQIKYTGE